MKKSFFAFLRMFIFAALVPVLATGLVACEPENASDIEDVTGKPVPKGAVDLGLSVYWASCNVGADTPEEYGDYFAWGETITKSDYRSSTSVTHGWSNYKLESLGIIDADGNLTAEYDAATANWGDSWRMPTLEEFKELRNNCTWEWTTQSGVYGHKVIGPNGNFIFFPAAGYRSYTSLDGAGSSGRCWSATVDSHGYAYRLSFYSYYYGWFYDTRFYGFTVRPVSDK